MESESQSPTADSLTFSFRAIKQNEASHSRTKTIAQSKFACQWCHLWKTFLRMIGKRRTRELLGEVHPVSVWTNPRVDGLLAIAQFDFKLKEQLSNTETSQIYRIRLFQSGEWAVLKCLVKRESEKTLRKKLAFRVARETNIWKALYSHPNVTTLFGSFETDKFYCYVMQYVHFRSLHDLISQGVSFERRSLKKIFAELASVLHTMHEVGVLHREITCSNILLSKEFGCSLSDFSSSANADSSCRPTASLAYMAPEVISSKQSYDKAADWWSYGIVLYAVNHKATPMNKHLENAGVQLKELSDDQRFELASNVKIHVDATLPMATRSLISELLRPEPQSRLGVRSANFELLRTHPFFIGFDWHHLRGAETNIITSAQTKLLLSRTVIRESADETSADERSADETSADETSADERSADERSADETANCVDNATV